MATTQPTDRVEAAAKTMRAQVAGDCRHQVAWDDITPERQAFWRARAVEVLAAADNTE